MRISRTNTPTQSLLIVSLEKTGKKTTMLPTEPPSVLPLLPAPLHPSSLIPHLPHLFLALRSPILAFSPSHLIPSVFRSQVFIGAKLWQPKIKEEWPQCVCVCVCEGDKLDIKFMQSCSGSRCRMYL